MKRYIVILLAVVLLAGCSEDKPATKALTFMVYMAADNSLSDYALADIDEMERADFDPSEVNVIVQADLSDYAEDPGCYRWLIEPDSLFDYEISSPRIKNLGEIDTGDWQSLVSFYNWCIDKYPAEEYVLSIWSHGNDWYSYPTNPNKFCPDNNSGSFFDIPEGDLQQAFAGFKQNPDLVILDACHMQSIEIISEIYTDCDYVCGSIDVIPNNGFPYAEIITQISRSPKNYTNLPQLYVNSYLPGGSQNWTGQLNQRVSASLIDCNLFSEQILPALVQFMEIYQNSGSTDLAVFRRECLEFNDLEIDIDIIQLFSLIEQYGSNSDLTAAAQDLSSQVITANDFYNYPAGVIGNLLVTFPEDDDLSTWEDLRQSYELLEFNQLTGWYDFLYENVILPATINSLP